MKRVKSWVLVIMVIFMLFPSSLFADTGTTDYRKFDQADKEWVSYKADGNQTCYAISIYKLMVRTGKTDIGTRAGYKKYLSEMVGNGNLAPSGMVSWKAIPKSVRQDSDFTVQYSVRNQGKASDMKSATAFIKTQLYQKGNYAIIHVPEGHYMPVSKITDDGKIEVWDSYKPNIKIRAKSIDEVIIATSSVKFTATKDGASETKPQEVTKEEAKLASEFEIKGMKKLKIGDKSTITDLRELLKSANKDNLSQKEQAQVEVMKNDVKDMGSFDLIDGLRTVIALMGFILLIYLLFFVTFYLVGKASGFTVLFYTITFKRLKVSMDDESTWGSNNRVYSRNRGKSSTASYVDWKHFFMMIATITALSILILSGALYFGVSESFEKISTFRLTP